MSECVCEDNVPSAGCPLHGNNEDIRVARDALVRLTPTERGRVFCWFCSLCHAFIPPGEGCPCGGQPL